MSRSDPEPRWNLADASSEAIDALCRELSIPAPAAQILVRRGWSTPTEAEAFLDSGPGDIADPFDIAELREAAERLAEAVDRGQRIVVHGDYDADGISGAALLTGALQRLGADAAAFVPDRARDGYGVSIRLVEHAGERGVDLIITVDTGSSAHDELARARELGIDVIVCDHHLFDRRPEGARHLLNPHRPDDHSRNKDLCGAAVAYKLLCGLDRVSDRPVEPEREIDLVAIALLADQMQLSPENRALVRQGLHLIQHDPRPGLVALLECARLIGQSIDEGDLVYQIAPRINAAGRIERARTAVDLLLAPDLASARPLAARLDSLNRRRRELDAQVTEEAIEQARAQGQEGLEGGYVLASADWHIGVVGIAAARVVEHFGAPAVLLAIEGDEARGSARSIGGLDLKATLDRCAEHLTRYGGHAAAAGMTLPARAIDGFRRRFAEVAASMPREAGGLGIELDAVLALEDIDDELVLFLRRFGPFGQGHREPLFWSPDLRLSAPPSVLKEKHLKLALRGDGRARDFIGFGLAPRYAQQLGSWPRLDVAFKVRYREGSPFDPWQLTLRALRSSTQSQEAQA